MFSFMRKERKYWTSEDGVIASSTLQNQSKELGEQFCSLIALPDFLVIAFYVNHGFNRENESFEGYLLLVFNDNHNFVNLTLFKNW